MDTRSNFRYCIKNRIVCKIDDSQGSNFKLSGGNTFEAEIFDISEGGVGIITSYFLPRGIILNLKICGKCFGLERDIGAIGEVRYSISNKQFGYKCGIKFIDMPVADKEIIANFIASVEKRKFPRAKLTDE